MVRMKVFPLSFLLLILIASCSLTPQKIKDNNTANAILEKIESPMVENGFLFFTKTLLHDEIEYDIEWTTSHGELFLPTGEILRPSEDIPVSFIAHITVGSTTKQKEFIIVIEKEILITRFVKPHQFIDRATYFDLSSMPSVVLNNGRIELADSLVIGMVQSPEFEATPFKSLVGSWAAISSANATVELQVRVRVDGSWSKYFSYKPWGLSLNNASVNDSDLLARLSIDEVLIKDAKLADAFQYKLFLRRNHATTPSPSVSLVSFALDIPNNSYEEVMNDLLFFDHDVPMLNQQQVPTIGSSICSPTSSTMLLQYKGLSFSDHDELEHRYMAGILRDYGARIYGNWVFNTVGMSAYGFDSYVGRMVSFEELKNHLIHIGPVAASISGNVGLYTTSGHLIVVRGFRIAPDGSTTVLVNDPNINARFGNDSEGNPLFVYYEFPLSVFMNVWKGIVYIIE